MSEILEVKGLNKSSEKVKLKDINLSLGEGSFAALAGRKSAGKTELIHTVLGLMKKDSGEIKIFGEDLTDNEQSVKSRVGVVFEEGSFYDELTMAGMKSIIAPAYPNWIETEYANYIEKFSLDQKHQIAALSQDKRLCFALSLALSHKTELLIIDEPDGGYDPVVRERLLLESANFIKNRGKAVLYVTSNIQDLEKTADTLIIMDKGQVLAQGEINAVLDGSATKNNIESERINTVLQALREGEKKE